MVDNLTSLYNKNNWSPVWSPSAGFATGLQSIASQLPENPNGASLYMGKIDFMADHEDVQLMTGRLEHISNVIGVDGRSILDNLDCVEVGVVTEHDMQFKHVELEPSGDFPSTGGLLLDIPLSSMVLGAIADKTEDEEMLIGVDIQGGGGIEAQITAFARIFRMYAEVVPDDDEDDDDDDTDEYVVEIEAEQESEPWGTTIPDGTVLVSYREATAEPESEWYELEKPGWSMEFTVRVRQTESKSAVVS